ncbi:hypothetical protein [Nocardioides insulae]|uniref:hypothetical protein n=1 Tax=Nocardioides insulae TaxID=394734 RepID=UPI000400AFC9|nr:hypothetical protein [Nocardioides insulae]
MTSTHSDHDATSPVRCARPNGPAAGGAGRHNDHVAHRAPRRAPARARQWRRTALADAFGHGRAHSAHIEEPTNTITRNHEIEV